jgi:hypothetical protein
MAKRCKIPIKSKQEIEKMREAGKVASDVLQRTAAFIAAGKTTREVDEYALSLMNEHNVKSAFHKYRDFPGYTCLSMNEEVVHGIGGDRVIIDGDLVKLDVLSGWVGLAIMLSPFRLAKSMESKNVSWPSLRNHFSWQFLTPGRASHFINCALRWKNM